MYVFYFYRILTDPSANTNIYTLALTLVEESASDIHQSDRIIREIIVVTWAGVGHHDAANDASQVREKTVCVCMCV